MTVRPGRAALPLLIAAEVATFGGLGTNFLTAGNGLEILRLAVELGLLAVALTPVIVAGGIDLSCGSIMGLAAVGFGLLWRDAGLPIPVAAALTLAIGALAGLGNGTLVARLRVPPLIATLGTFSLYRGIAEGLTRGVDNFTDFPGSFLFLGQGYVGGTIPAQVPIFLVAALGFGFWLNASIAGRALHAIGLSPDGARHAALPVDRLVATTYVLSGLASSLAALIYVAHLGQAKADAGLGYELSAITAVVLGGTSIFGGRGTVGGTVLGLLAIATLQNGLRLADLPSELAGVLTGALLLIAIGLDRPRRAAINRHAPTPTAEGLDVKNSQVAWICGSILLAGLLVAGTNAYLVRTLGGDRAVSPPPTVAPSALGPSIKPARTLTVAMMPKSKGNAYFQACRLGADEAARASGVTLIWDGPTDPDPARQNEIVDTWITRGVDVIAVAVENRRGISSVLRKARSRGIKVVTWDADADPDARDLFVNQATPRGIGEALMDGAAEILGGRGEFAIITASLTAANMIAWQEQIEARRASKYPGIRMAALRPCDDLQKKAFDETNTLLAARPEIKLFMAICTPAVPGAAEAIKQSGRTDVKVIGLGLPNDNKPYVKEGITDRLILWKTADLGYLAVLAARAVAEGTWTPGLDRIEAGRLGTIRVDGSDALLGKPFAFTKDNIDQFDF